VTVDVPGLIAVVIVAVLAPVIAARLLQRGILKQAAADRQATWDREDTKERARIEAAKEVARVQARAAADLAVSQEKIAAAAEATRLQAVEAAELLVESNAKATALTGVIVGKLDKIDLQNDQIHTLVNQKLSDAIERALAATVLLLAAQEEAVNRTRAVGETPAQAALTRIEQTRAEIADLRATLSARASQQAIVDAGPKTSDQAGGG